MSLKVKIAFILMLNFTFSAVGAVAVKPPAPSAVGAVAEKPPAPSNEFDLNAAYENYSKIENRLSQDNVKVETLSQGISQLTNLQDSAKLCAKTSTKKIESLTELLDSTQQQIGNGEPGKALREFKEEKSRYEKLAAECKLLDFKANEAVNRFSEKLSRLSASKTLSKNTYVWHLLFRESYKNLRLNTKLMYQRSGLGQLQWFHWIFLSLGLIAAAIIGILKMNYLGKRIRWINKKRRFSYFFLKITRAYIVPLVVLTTACVMLSCLFTLKTPYPMILSLSYGLLAYVFLSFLGHLLVFRPLSRQDILKLRRTVRKRLFHRYQLVLALGALGGVFSVLMAGQPLPKELAEAWHSLFIIVMTASSLWMVWTVTQFRVYQRAHPLMKYLIKTLLTFASLAIIIIEALGYHILGLYLIEGIILTAALVGLMMELVKLCEHGFEYIENPKYAISQQVRQVLGINYHRSIPEITLIRIVLYSCLLGFFIMFVMQAWQVSIGRVETFKDAMLDGFTFSKIEIIPTRILMGLSIFTCLFIFVRAVASYTAGHYNRWDERENQIALASIITYMGFSASLVVALLISGVNFAGLAIIAGALSVGIGFGLQHIANNFISGVILLIQNPIKSGDRVLIAGIEGIVKKIRILSTQVTTMSNEDVIIPNSDLITHPVTNYMFRDSFWRVTCQVGVAYGSAIDLVVETLLEVARNNPDVVQEGRHRPQALFRSFGDSALVFELWAVIHDVNKKYQMQSQLNIAIDAAFREKGIVIAFPQVDVHFK